MQEMAKGPDGCGMANHSAKAAILSIFDFTQPVPVFDHGLPTGELSSPRADVIVDADVTAEHVTAPTVVIARDPQDGDAGVHEIRDRREDSKRWSRDDRTPLEPELEEVAVDDERPRATA
jgi:hypothetical protein